MIRFAITIIFISITFGLSYILENSLCRYLRENYKFIDKTRTGVWGSGYGGYITGKLLEQDNGTFQCGVAVAPITSWKHHGKVDMKYLFIPLVFLLIIEFYIREKFKLRYLQFLIPHVNTINYTVRICKFKHIFNFNYPSIENITLHCRSTMIIIQNSGSLILPSIKQKTVYFRS